MARSFLTLYATASISLMLGVGLMCLGLFDGPQHWAILFPGSYISSQEHSERSNLRNVSEQPKAAATLADFVESEPSQQFNHDHASHDQLDQLINVEAELHAPLAALATNATFSGQTLPKFPPSIDHLLEKGDTTHVAQVTTQKLPATSGLIRRSGRPTQARASTRPASYFSLKSAGSGSEGKASGNQEFLMNEGKSPVSLFKSLFKG